MQDEEKLRSRRTKTSNNKSVIKNDKRADLSPPPGIKEGTPGGKSLQRAELGAVLQVWVRAAPQPGLRLNAAVWAGGGERS